MSLPVTRYETKHLKKTLSGAGALDTRNLEEIFESCRTSDVKMQKLVEAFCEAYLYDGKQRPLKLRPLQMDIIIASLTHAKNGKQRKLAILA